MMFEKFVFFLQAEDGIRDPLVTGVQTCALPIYGGRGQFGDQWRTLVAELPPAAVRLADRFWPGPLTIVCRRAAGLPRLLGGGGETIGVRQPGLPIAMALCRALGLPIVGTSANTHGLPAPVTAAHVALDVGPDVDLILDGGRCPLGRPSTVIDVTRTPPVVVRAGAVSVEAAQDALGQTLAQAAVALQR